MRVTKTQLTGACVHPGTPRLAHAHGARLQHARMRAIAPAAPGRTAPDSARGSSLQSGRYTSHRVRWSYRDVPSGTARGTCSTPRSRSSARFGSAAWAGGVRLPHMAKMFSDLPVHLQARVLLTDADQENLLRHVSTCARVCKEWWHVVRESAPYGHAVKDRPQRARVMLALSRALQEAELTGGDLTLSYEHIDETCACVLAPALRARPALTEISMIRCSLTAASMSTLAEGIWRLSGLRSLDIHDNADLGDAGIAALAARRLPSTLQDLAIAQTGCGDAGMVALAAALPPAIRLLNFDQPTRGTNDVRDTGWVALGKALHRLPSFTSLRPIGMGNVGLIDMAPSLPGAALRVLDLSNNPDIGDTGLRALLAVLPRCYTLTHLLLQLFRVERTVRPYTEHRNFLHELCADVEAAACDRPPGKPLAVHWFRADLGSRCNIDGEYL